MKQSSNQNLQRPGADGGELREFELSDEDILDAMGHISGYLDITTTDFREIYKLAHAHALDRLFRNVRAGTLMRIGIEPLRPATRLDEAARLMARQGRKGLPVVDGDARVVGMLTETDLLSQLGADSLPDLLLALIEDQVSVERRYHEIPAEDAMTAPAVTIGEDAGFRDIVGAFHAHEGRGMPVVDAQGRLRGLLLRKDFVQTCHLEALQWG